MPGGGKSTVGRHLARALGIGFIDVDAEIEKSLGRSIRDYFADEGETRFRDVEQQILAAQLARTGARTLATGGGVVLREDNRIALRAHSTVLYLRSTPEELFRRLRHDRRRPLLQVADPLRRLRELFHQRDPLYRRTAHFVIETGRPSVSMLVSMILMQLELAGLVDPSRVPSPVDAPPHSA